MWFSTPYEKNNVKEVIESFRIPLNLFPMVQILKMDFSSEFSSKITQFLMQFNIHHHNSIP